MNISNKQVRSGTWTTGLCDCCEDPMSCCEAMYCFQCQISAQYGMLNKGIVGIDPLCCIVICCLDDCTGFCACCIANCMNRGEIRRRYMIDGGCCGDCIYTCCCYSCALSQQYREMCYRGMYPGGVCVSPPAVSPQPALMDQQLNSPFIGAQQGHHQQHKDLL